MSRPGYRSSIARPSRGPSGGAGDSGASQPEVLHIDYADVLAQAVINERHRVLREIRLKVESIETSKRDSDYRTKDVSWQSVKGDVLNTISRLENA